MSVRATFSDISLTWVKPHDNNAPITKYKVAYMQQSETGERERVVNTTVEMATITDLSPGVTYTITVTAINEIGPSVPSATRTVMTLAMGQGEGKLILHCNSDNLY